MVFDVSNVKDGARKCEEGAIRAVKSLVGVVFVVSERGHKGGSLGKGMTRELPGRSGMRTSGWVHRQLREEGGASRRTEGI